MEITVYEGDASKADFTLMYSQGWTVAAKRGTPVLQSDVDTVYFYVKTLLSDVSPWLSLTSASASQISWINGPGATDGKVRVTFGTTTEGRTGDGQWYELRLKLTNGSFITAIRGRFNVLESVIDTP